MNLMPELFQKGRKAFFCAFIEVLFMAKTQIISQPLYIVSVLCGRNILTLQKSGVAITELAGELNH